MHKGVPWALGSLLLLTVILAGIGMAIQDNLKKLGFEPRSFVAGASNATGFMWDLEDSGADEAHGLFSTTTLEMDEASADEPEESDTATSGYRGIFRTLFQL